VPFDLSITKLLVLAVIAVVVFGPDQLPKVATQAGQALRSLRRMAELAKDDWREGLGPEFSDFDFADLDPRHLVRKHLLEEPNGSSSNPYAPTNGASATLLPGEKPPYDSEAT
jgi:sec-independent protein translocase protein TatB